VSFVTVTNYRTKQAVLVLARSTATARLSAAADCSAPVPTTAAAKKREDKERERRRRRCPNGLLVRAVEALGRVYMHREAALVDSGGGSDGDAAASAAQQQRDDGTSALGGAAGVNAASEEEMSTLRPMPFSVKMRELVVWATNTVLPVLIGGTGNGTPGVHMVEDGGTPGELDT